MKKASIVLSLFFALSALAQGQVKFAHITDLHVIPGNANDSLMSVIVREINDSDNQYVVVTGDLSNQGSDAELTRVWELLRPLKIPYYIISGNHETTWSESGTLTFNKIWGQDRFVEDKGDYLLIGFPCGPNMKMGDGFIKCEDILWVDKTLKERLRAGQKVLVFAHYPLDNSVSNYAQMLAVLAKYPVAAYFFGHGHNIVEYNFSGLKGIMGRSVISRDGKTNGYNEVVITDGKIEYYEKAIGGAATKKITMDNTPSTIKIGELNFDTKPHFVDVASTYHTPTVDEGVLYTANSLGDITAVKNGTVLWRKGLGRSIYARPTVVNDIVVVGGIDSTLYGLDKASGTEKWRVRSPRIFAGEAATEGENIYVASSREFLKINAMDGTVLWRTELPKSYSQGKPVVTDRYVIFGVWDTNVYCVDKETGALVWRWNNGSVNELLSPGNVAMFATGGQLWLVAPDRVLTILDVDKGTIKHRTKEWKIRESMGHSADYKLFYGKTMDGELVVLPTDRIPSAENVRVVDPALGYEHNPCPIFEHGGRIYLGSRGGEVVVVDARTLKILNTKKLGTSSVNGFTADGNGKVWCSLIEGSTFEL